MKNHPLGGWIFIYAVESMLQVGRIAYDMIGKFYVKKRDYLIVSLAEKGCFVI